MVADMSGDVQLTVYAGLAGDRNDRGMAGAILLGEELDRATGISRQQIGTPALPQPGGWADQLQLAKPELFRLATELDRVLASGARPLTTMARCAAGLATLPVIARHHPDATIVWFDAHGDSNVPEGRPPASYLGGMVLTGAAGRWKTGLGTGLDYGRVVLVGSRDLDPPERDLIARGALRLVEPGPDLASRLAAAVGEGPVYVHIDCDVLEPGLVPTEYQVPEGLSFADLRAACTVLARSQPIGLEIAEFESHWSDGRPAQAAELIDAIGPLLAALRQPTVRRATS